MLWTTCGRRRTCRKRSTSAAMRRPRASARERRFPASAAAPGKRPGTWGSASPHAAMSNPLPRAPERLAWGSGVCDGGTCRALGGAGPRLESHSCPASAVRLSCKRAPNVVLGSAKFELEAERLTSRQSGTTSRCHAKSTSWRHARVGLRSAGPDRLRTEHSGSQAPSLLRALQSASANEIK